MVAGGGKRGRKRKGESQKINEGVQVKSENTIQLYRIDMWLSLFGVFPL